MLIHDYSKAATALLCEGKPIEDVLDGLLQTATRHGHKRLLAAILRDIIRQFEKLSTGDIAEVRVVREQDAQKFQNEIRATLTSLGADGKPSIVIDKNIIGGSIVSFRNNVVDASYKKQLLSLYKTIIQ